MTLLPLTSVIVNYNAGDWLVRCVSSLVAEQVGEIIVVDNGSVDGSLNDLDRNFAQQLSSGQLKVLRQGQNTGFSKACNAGAARALNPYLLFLNPDSSAHPGSVGRLLGLFQKHTDFGLIGGKIFNTDGTEQSQAKRGFPALGFFKPKTLGEHVISPQHNGSLTADCLEVEPVQAISGSCMLISKRLYTQIAGFDERYTLHCEDLDLCAKVHQQGLKVGYVNSAHFTHAKGICSTTNALWVEWQKHKSMVYFYFKHQPRLYNPLDLMLVVPGLMAHLAWVWLKIKVFKNHRP